MKFGLKNGVIHCFPKIVWNDDPKKLAPCKWVSHFSKGQNGAETEVYKRLSVFHDKNRINALIEEQHLTTETTANAIDISIDSAFTIMTAKERFHMMGAKTLVPWSITDENRNADGTFHKWDKGHEAFLCKTVIGDET